MITKTIEYLIRNVTFHYVVAGNFLSKIYHPAVHLELCTTSNYLLPEHK